VQIELSQLREKVIKGAAWMVGMRFAVNILSIASMVVLARLLTPEDFGIVALAGSAFAFFSVLGQFGFDSALIHMRDAEKAHYDTAWTANILVGVAIALIMFVVAKPAAIFFQNARIENVVYSFSILSLAKGFENIGVVNFRKSLAFRGDFYYFVIPKIASVVIGISAALILRNYWALVIGMTGSQIVSLIYSHFSQSLRPRLSLSKFGELFRFTRWILGSNMLHFAAVNGVQIMLGRLRDASAVGIFGIAKQIAFLPSTEILTPVSRALFPGFSTISGDAARVRTIFCRVLGFTALFVIPAGFGIFTLSDSLVIVILGQKWSAVSPILSVLGLLGIIEAAKRLIGPVLLARGRPRILTNVLAVYVVILVPSVLVGIKNFGVVGVAYAMLLATVLTTPMLFVAVNNEIGITLSSVWQRIWRPLIASATMAVVIKLSENRLIADAHPNVSALVLLVLIGTAIYCLTIFLLWLIARRPEGSEKETLAMLGEFLRRFRSPE